MPPGNTGKRFASKEPQQKTDSGRCLQPRPSSRFLSFVRSNDLLHLLVTAQVDTASVVNMLWFNFQHPLHLTVHSHTPCIFEYHCHWLYLRLSAASYKMEPGQ